MYPAQSSSQLHVTLHMYAELAYFTGGWETFSLHVGNDGKETCDFLDGNQAIRDLRPQSFL